MRKIVYFLISCALVFSSCQKKLTKEQALDLIVGGGYMKVIEKERFSLYEQFQVTYVNYIENLCDGATICSQPWIDDSHRPWSFVSKEDQKILDVLKNNNLISIDDSSDFSSCCVKRLISLRPLKDSQKLMEKYAKIEEVTNHDFIGGDSKGTFLRIQTLKPQLNTESLRLKVVEDGKKVEVEFSISVVCNEIGQLLYSNCNQGEYWYVATIEMYDQGWQVTHVEKLKKDF